MEKHTMNFMSKELQEAFNKAKPVLEQITQTKDQISNEIKYLEDFLKGLAINDSFGYRIQSPFDTSSFTDCDIGEFSLAGWAVTNEELLIWDKEKKRLMYQLIQYNADVQFDTPNPVILDESSRKQLILKPLIETSFEIRKKVYEQNHLCNFLLELTSKYQVNLKKEIDLSDIPF